MSEVIRFRLNPNNLREAQALEILRIRQEEGYSIRQVLTEALIGLTSNPERDANFSTQEFQDMLEQLSQLLKRIGENLGNGERIQPENPQPFSMNDIFLSSVKMAAKSGMKLE